MKKQSIILLVIGLVLTIVGAIFCYNNYNSNYAKSVEVGKKITEIKNQVKEEEEAGNADKVAELKKEQSSLESEKLSLEKPYSYSLIILFGGILIAVVAIVMLVGKKESTPVDIKRLTQAALCAALCYIGFTFFQIPLTIGTEKTAFHFGNVFCVLAALLCGGLWGGLSGAVGMTIADLTTAYVTSAPKTFLLKLFIGLIVGLVAHKIFKLSKDHSHKYTLGVTIGASAAGMAFNIVADPLVGYFYKTYLLGVPQDLSKAIAKLGAVTTSVNAVIAVIAATIIYMALRPVLKKAGLFTEIQ
ncbi:MAG: ECF transporter S component [Lachnospiraceae bacterium]